MKSVVVTGVSSGIGYDACKLFLEKGYHVFGSVRNKTDARNLSSQFSDKFTPLIFDIRDTSAIRKASKIVSEKLSGRTLSALVNNAGVANIGPLELLPSSDFREQIETNVVGTFTCIQEFLPLLHPDAIVNEAPPGRIVNISSALGGKIGYPFYGAYCASKHALEGLSETLRRELCVYGIKVIIVAPGAIVTPIWGKAEKKNFKETYSNTVYEEPFKKNMKTLKSLGAKGLSPTTVAKTILKAVEDPKPKLRYFFLKELMLTLLYYTPKSILDILICNSLGLKKK
ncbi:MAG: SDR family oxidoreductase [Pseudomonadota bacterium]|nr:SDR family oxidoreductase [Pseudomonadota bacterium]